MKSSNLLFHKAQNGIFDYSDEFHIPEVCYRYHHMAWQFHNKVRTLHVSNKDMSFVQSWDMEGRYLHDRQFDKNGFHILKALNKFFRTATQDCHKVAVWFRYHISTFVHFVFYKVDKNLKNKSRNAIKKYKNNIYMMIKKYLQGTTIRNLNSKMPNKEKSTKKKKQYRK